jgi:hypothetical protein
MGFAARISVGSPVAEASTAFLFLDSAVSMVSASFHLMQCSLRDPRLLSLFVSRETRPSSSGVSKKMGRAAALPKWSARAEPGRDATLAGAVAADCVPDLRICSILRVPDLSGTEVLARAEVLAGTAVLAGAAVLVGAEVFSAEGVLGAGYSGAAGVARPAEAGSGIVWTSGTAGPFPLISMPVLSLLAPASSVVPALLVGAPESEAACWAPVSRWTSGAEGFY